jgi:hypothetical protein
MASCGCYYCSPDPCVCRFVNPEAKQPMTSVGAALIEANVKYLESIKTKVTPTRLDDVRFDNVTFETDQTKLVFSNSWTGDFLWSYTPDKIVLDDKAYEYTRFTWTPTKETWGVQSSPKPLTMAGVVEQARELCQADDDDYDCCEEDIDDE